MSDLVQDTFDRDGYVIIDDFLYEDVVNKLHNLAINCEEHDDVYKEGYYSINYKKDNLPFDILPDIINAIHVGFPILHDLEFDRGWVFVHDNKSNGVTPHADPAKINVNLWVTPDHAVNDPTKNGLIVYDQKAPDDWTWSQYNSDIKMIEKYLKDTDAKERHIPYRYNRICLFDSKYFHKTNGVSMWHGPENRRVNYTFMFK